MSNLSPTLTMIGLDLLMIVYTLWAFSLGKPSRRAVAVVAVSLLAWLGALHLGIASQHLFPPSISGVAFLLVIFAAVGLVGVVLHATPTVRRLLWSLDQRQLLLLQGVRVFFGGTFLMHASLGVLPPAFGIIDGFTHIGAGFFGLIAAFSVASGRDGVRRAWFANVFGLADILIVATSLALVLLPEIGPYHPMMYAVFLPAPLWLWFHLVSIAKLLGRDGTSEWKNAAVSSEIVAS